jgi:hypothetical protein
MSLIDYLNKYFTYGDSGVFEGETVSIVPHFFDKFGVDVKKEGPYFLFKYNMLTAKFAIPITSECRGIIFKYNNGWEISSLPYSKFFNFHEGFCTYTESSFNNTSLSFKEKLDGTCIQVWWCDIQNKFRASTLGTITPHYVGDNKVKFDELFFKTIPSGWESVLDKDNTYIFELCCEMNRIVSKYASDRVYLCGIRNKKTGIYLPIDEIAVLLNVRIPKTTMFYEVDIKNKLEMMKFVEENTKDDDDCKYKEGFVVYDGLKPAFKCKSARYLDLHTVGTGDIKATRNRIIECYWNNTLDDYYHALVPEMQSFSDELRNKVSMLISDATTCANAFRNVTFDSQRDYAIAVQKQVPREFWSFFFAHKNDIISGNVSDVYSTWLRLNWQKFEWK